MTRKSHKKSRDGCVECKRRHIKCDETKPQCTNCVVVERTCEYAAIRRRKPPQARQGRVEAARKSTPETLRTETPRPPENLTPAFRTSTDAIVSAASTPAQGASAVSPEHSLPSANASGPDASVNIHHMRLILHFSLPTAVPEIPDHLAKGGTELVLRVALETPYLLHQILALSARHLAHAHPSEFQFYYGQALNLQTKAIEGFSASQPLTSDACMPAVLFSSLLSRHSLVDTLNNTRQGEFAAFLDSFVQCAQLQRGIRAVVSGVSWSSLLESDLAPLLEWGARSAHQAARGHECDQLLRLIAITPGLDPVSRESCRTAAYHLQVGLDELTRPVSGKNSYQMLFSWNIYLPEEFIDLLAQHRPEAAAIMGWYAVLLHHGRHLWHIGDAGDFILRSLVDFLGVEWSHWLEWPRSMVLVQS
ncbi:Sterol uptake control protein 2 [Beauveria bassiana]|uniref:Sterol uptake control protein 2 n=1 Tax=Beauveria bassiana TaxID=176275 RepID=A0A2N6P314_BEABA|nr:Sterol uptake control protein 2 [Beauveria bassiana]